MHEVRLGLTGESLVQGEDKGEGGAVGCVAGMGKQGEGVVDGVLVNGAIGGVGADETMQQLIPWTIFTLYFLH